MDCADDLHRILPDHIASRSSRNMGHFSTVMHLPVQRTPLHKRTSIESAEFKLQVTRAIDDISSRRNY
jgi:hypothetical protein